MWMYNKTCLGWDYERNTITGPDDVIASLVANVMDGERLVKAGLQCFDLCTEMFKDNVATGSGGTSNKRRPQTKQSQRESKFNDVLDEWREMNEARSIRTRPEAKQSCDACLAILNNMEGLYPYQHVKALRVLASATQRILFLGMNHQWQRIWVDSFP
ncbi:hypothetical protein BUALT_Bualt09G0004700 [Buddleja alternifolia]|uniref:Uncharacterized protein n=1 Tax=Buddleja alternifolia TaxID=168488 RepID=A0AAV6WZF4_9LAMI|nr:hypothetical protein BUALT_Bualt09G0004700 [Buddleja alternifolia]